MGLKYEDQIFRKDFSSASVFRQYMDRKINDLEQLKARVNQWYQEAETLTKGNQIRKSMEHTYQDMIETINGALGRIREARGNLRE